MTKRVFGWFSRYFGAAPLAAALALAAALVAGGAWAAAPTPTVVWESDFVDNGTKTGTDGNTYTFKIDNTGNSIDNGVLVISSTATRGATIELGDTAKTKISVLVKYSNLSAPGGTSTTNCFASIRLANGNNFPLLRNENASSLKAGLSYAGSALAAMTFNDSGASFPNGSGYALFSYSSGSGTKAYVGSDIASLSGKEITGIKWSNYNITRIALGGPCADNTNPNATAWPNLKIEKVAIFLDTYYSAADVSDFKWPSEVAADLKKWIDDSRTIYAWRGGANFHEGRFGAVSPDGTIAAGTTVNYTEFGENRPAPGHVLYYDAAGYTANTDAQFTPFAIGGLCVKSAADSSGTPYTVRGYNSTDTNRQTWLGAAGYETYFEFDESFVFARTNGVSQIAGTVNLSVAAGKEFDLNSQVGEKSAARLASGAVLKMSGEGNLKVYSIDAIDGTLDFSALSGRSAALPFINGTVKLGANTGIVLPAGTTSPYKLGTAITGTYPNSLTIGTKTYAAVVSAGENAGEIAWDITDVTISEARDNYDISTIFGSAPVSTKDYRLNVEENATLTIGSTTVRTITIDVAEGKTLTLSGSALTATTIYITGKGTVKATTAGVLKGTLKGDGTVMYTVKPTLGSGNLVATDYAWEGVLWIKSVNIGGILPQDCASTNSTIRLTGCTGYFNNGDSLMTCPGTLDLQDDGSTKAFEVTNGFSTNGKSKFAKLTGSGTFVSSTGTSQRYIFTDPSEFKGVINIPSGRNTRVILGDSEDNAGNGTVYVVAGATVTNVAGKVWTVQGGLKVAGDFTVDNTCTLKFTNISGSLTIAADKTLTMNGNIDSLNYGGSGTVNVYGTLNMNTTRWTIGGSNVINLYEGGTISGVGQSPYGALDWYQAGSINVYGTSTISANIRCRDNGNLSFNVVSGTCTFSGESYGARPITKTGSGTLKIAYTGNSTYNLPSLGAGTIEFSSGTWNLGSLRDLSGYTLEEGSSIAITQTMAEYGSGVTTVTGVDSSIASITVNKADGTTVAITPSDGAATLVESVVVSGAACWYDFTFTNTVKSATGSSGSSTSLTTTDVSSFEYVTIQDYAQPTPNSYTAIPTYVRPYSGINLGSKTQFCVALYGTMPSTDNTVLLFLGDGYAGGALILASGTSANEAVLYYYTTGKVLTELKRMPASSCRTAPHLYVFQKVGDHQVDIYLDGKLSLSYVNNDITFTLNTGFQVASGYRGTPTGLSGISSSATSEPSAIAMTRIYDRLLTSAEITQLAIEWPYYSPNGDSSRTLDVGETTPDWVETGKWLFNNTSADAAAANSNVEFVNNAGAAASVAVNLNANTAYESLAVSGDNAVSFALKSGFTGKIVPGAATFSADTTVAYDAADFSSTRVEVADGKTLTFDVSSIVTANGNWPNAASVDRIQLTGIATLGTGAVVAVSPATAGYWNLSAVEDGGYYYLSVAPGRANCDIYWKNGTYWNSTYNLTGSNPDNPAVFTTDAEGQTPTKYFAGDTVIIPTTTKRYFGPISDGAAIRFDCNGAIEVTKTDSLGYVFKNATVTVASGTTLNFVNSWNGASPEVYGGTISGAGKVQVASGITLTLSNGATIAAATALTGAGTVNCATVPTAQMTFDGNWTGTVSLPSFHASSGVNFNNYGTTGSTVALAGMTGGYILEAGKTVAPTLRLDGAMNITAMSSRTYTFAEITGTGNLSFSTSANSPNVTITKVAEGYSGTITSTLATPVAITTLARAAGTPTAAGAKLLDTGNATSVMVGAVTIGGEAAELDLVYKADGVYVSELQGAGYWVGTMAVITNSEETVTVPSGATALRIYPSANDTSLVLTAEQAQNLLGTKVICSSYAIGETDITGAFTASEPVAVDGGQKITLSLSATNGNSPTTVMVDEETISVAPALAAAAPMTLDESATPTFAVKTIPGLWYRVEAGTETDGNALGGTGTAGASVQATSTSTALAAPAFPKAGNVLFYKIAVGISRDDIEPAAEP